MGYSEKRPIPGTRLMMGLRPTDLWSVLVKLGAAPAPRLGKMRQNSAPVVRPRLRPALSQVSVVRPRFRSVPHLVSVRPRPRFRPVPPLVSVRSIAGLGRSRLVSPQAARGFPRVSLYLLDKMGMIIIATFGGDIGKDLSWLPAAHPL